MFRVVREPCCQIIAKCRLVDEQVINVQQEKINITVEQAGLVTANLGLKRNEM